MYVLMIIATVATGIQSVEMQEFSSQDSCEAAKEFLNSYQARLTIKAAANGLPIPKDVDLSCIPK